MLEMKITVVGFGGAGLNTINHMIKNGLTDINFIAVDKKHLEYSMGNKKVLIDESITEGIAAKDKIHLPKDDVIEGCRPIRDAISDSHIVFILAGLGGVTGNSASPVIAEICRESGISLTIGITSLPSSYEGQKRTVQAEAGFRELQTVLDSIVVIPCDNIDESISKKMSIAEFYRQIDHCVYLTFRGIVEFLSSFLQYRQY